MGAIADLFSSVAGAHKRAHEALSRLATEKAVTLAELEGSAVRFKTRVFLTDDSVVLAKPDGFQAKGLAVGAGLRLRLPGDESHQVRLEVAAPHVNMANGKEAIVCRLPNARAVRAQRRSQRYDLGERSGVRLVIPQRGREFPLADISAAGCSVTATRMEAETYFPIGDTLRNVRILAGSKTAVEIAELMPRDHRGRAVGFAFRVKEDPASRANLERIIRVLEAPRLAGLGREGPARQ
jgi:hypothetical protein